jgi:decaprenylphospho-beta-D-erythro-pentofuranosid-2-ulose 2-reductase
MQKILIIGATSAIAEATARLFAARGDRLYLLARNRERLETMAKDLKIRGAGSVAFDVLDVNEFDRHPALLDAASTTMDGIDIVLIAHGTLPDQKTCEGDFRRTLEELNTNAIGTISLLTHLANRFEQQRHGVIAAISSVAGDRGRQSNYVYGTAKAAVTVFLQGLRNRLYKSGVKVLTIKPGFVDTPMTADFSKGLLWAQPEKIAKDILKAISASRSVLYTPWFWRPVMVLIRLIPEPLFKRLSL